MSYDLGQEVCITIQLYHIFARHADSNIPLADNKEYNATVKMCNVWGLT